MLILQNVIEIFWHVSSGKIVNSNICIYVYINYIYVYVIIKLSAVN